MGGGNGVQMQANGLALRLGDVDLPIAIVDGERQWSMTVEDVARGYGVDRTAIVKILTRHADEIRDGIERGVTICHTPGGTQKKTVIYREGVIKLGFFVRSERAKEFRQAATDYLTREVERADNRAEVSNELLTQIKIQLCLAPAPRDYKKTFPTELFAQFARLSGKPHVPGKHPMWWSQLIADIYKSLDVDVYSELKRRNPDPTKGTHHHDYATDEYREAVARRCEDVILLAKVSRDIGDFRAKFNSAFRGRPLQMTIFDIKPQSTKRLRAKR
jgi:hypothetical protein